jgi:hypothetical protein
MTISDLFRQRKMTAHDLMLGAKYDVDEMFGDGYTAKHPELVAAYIHAASYDLRSMVEHDDREAARCEM